MYYQTSLLSFMANKLGRIEGEKGENCLLIHKMGIKMKIKINTELRVVTFKLDGDLLQKLDLYAVNAGVTRSEVIREALKRYLASKVRE